MCDVSRPSREALAPESGDEFVGFVRRLSANPGQGVAEAGQERTTGGVHLPAMRSEKDQRMAPIQNSSSSFQCVSLSAFDVNLDHIRHGQAGLEYHLVERHRPDLQVAGGPDPAHRRISEIFERSDARSVRDGGLNDLDVAHAIVIKVPAQEAEVPRYGFERVHSSAFACSDCRDEGVETDICSQVEYHHAGLD